MDKYDAMNDHYCYQSTSVLINKLNIKDSNDLEDAERDITSKTIENITYSVPPYDLEYLKVLHLKLFEHLYDWAGKLRDVDISKGNTRFCSSQYIESEAKRLFKKLKDDNWLHNLNKNDFCSKLAEHYCEFNMLHPFREGNGRVQRLFFEHLALSNRYKLDWKDIDRYEWLQANIDGVNVDYSAMEAIFDRILIHV